MTESGESPLGVDSTHAETELRRVDGRRIRFDTGIVTCCHHQDRSGTSRLGLGHLLDGRPHYPTQAQIQDPGAGLDGIVDP